MREELKEFANEMEKLLKKHDDIKGDSWKTCSFRYLQDKLDEEYDEVLRTGKIRLILPAYITFKFTDKEMKVKDSDEIEYLLNRKKKELIDLANICMMMYKRCNMMIEKNNKKEAE